MTPIVILFGIHFVFLITVRFQYYGIITNFAGAFYAF